MLTAQEQHAARPFLTLHSMLLALQVLVGTWNVNETKPSRAGLQMWLADRVRTAHLVMVGLQVCQCAAVCLCMR